MKEIMSNMAMKLNFTLIERGRCNEGAGTINLKYHGIFPAVLPQKKINKVSQMPSQTWS